LIKPILNLGQKHLRRFLKILAFEINRLCEAQSHNTTPMLFPKNIIFVSLPFREMAAKIDRKIAIH